MTELKWIEIIPKTESFCPICKRPMILVPVTLNPQRTLGYCLYCKESFIKSEIKIKDLGE